MEPTPNPDRWRPEALAVAGLTLIGAILRVWPPGRLGLTHFDEGIYALAASWIFDPKGIASIDPTLIPYAPPGFPILVGLAYGILGRSDTAAIAASQVAGLLTIPVVAWLARRTFGPGSGFAAATFATFSGPHIAFSRMALTDASFLLSWLIAVGLGMRFLERPGAIRAVTLGFGVGLTQQFKYNGWLAGAIMIGAAILGILSRPEERRSARIAQVFGWGILGAGMAALVVLPWYRFVEGNSGYSALLRHQRNYLGGIRDWWPRFRIQCDQSIALLPGLRVGGFGLILACLAPWIARSPAWDEVSRRLPRSRMVFLAILIGVSSFALIGAPFWLGLMLAPWVLTLPDPAVRIVGVWWLVLTVLTPFYHPYARLWLPLHAVNWLLLGCLIARFPSGVITLIMTVKSSAEERWRGWIKILSAAAAFSLGGFISVQSMREARPQPDWLGPSDSLRRSTALLGSRIPDEVAGLRLLVRPSVTYYLAGRVPLYPMSGSDQLLRPGDPRLWAVVDAAILRSESGDPSGGSCRELPARFANRWELVEEFPTILALPTLLDIDPRAARDPTADRSATLWLLRPRRPGPLP